MTRADSEIRSPRFASPDKDPEEGYGLRWNPRPRLFWRFAALAAIMSISSILISRLAVDTLPAPKPIGTFYFASVFYALVTYWFGGWGLLSSYVGSVIGAGIYAGLSLETALVFSVANLIEPLVPFLLIRTAGRRVGIHPLCTNLVGSPVYLVWFLFFGALLPPFLSGLWGITALARAGIIRPDSFWVALGGWWAGASILLLVGVPLVGKLVGVHVARKNMASLGIWS